jgi:hypothetical protein
VVGGGEQRGPRVGRRAWGSGERWTAEAGTVPWDQIACTDDMLGFAFPAHIFLRDAPNSGFAEDSKSTSRSRLSAFQSWRNEYRIGLLPCSAKP